MNAPREIPAFLQRREPVAQLAYWSDGRLAIVKGEQEVSLSPDDLTELRKFFAHFERGGE